MTDDLFDQIVEDALAEEARKEESEDAENDDDLLAIDDELLADEEDEPAAMESNFEITSDEPKSDDPKSDEPKSDAPKAEKPAAPKAPEKEKADEPAASSKPAAKSTSADSDIDGKSSGKPALPIVTGDFVHPDYLVAGTLSAVSARRVVQLGKPAEGQGRSTEAEKLIAAAEREIKVELRALAAKRGGHALVGTTFGTAAPGGGLLVVTAVGTPIRLKKRSSEK